MDEGRSAKRSRLAILSPSAAQDLASIYAYTVRWWGYEQAERYTDLIKEAVESASDPNTEHVREIEDRPGLFAIVVRWKRTNYSHLVVFRRTDFGAEIVRILHSAMDFDSHI